MAITHRYYDHEDHLDALRYEVTVHWMDGDEPDMVSVGDYPTLTDAEAAARDALTERKHLYAQATLRPGRWIEDTWVDYDHDEEVLDADWQEESHADVWELTTPHGKLERF